MGYFNTPGKFNNNTWLIDAASKNPEGIKKIKIKNISNIVL